jgi:CO dehydrogenase maturation factor
VSFKLAVAGKGGTGKTTAACLFLASLLRSGRTPVLAVDADPNSCLAEYLGFSVDHTLGEIQDNVLEKKDEMPAGVAKAQLVEYEIHKALHEENGYDLITMGRTEGPGCYCYVNNLLRGYMGDIEKNYESIVIDNEAGMEHLSRRTSRDVDVLAVVADDSRASLKAAARIVELVSELKIGVARKALVLNRTDEAKCTEPPIAGLEFAGCLPADPGIKELEEAGRSLLELPEDSPASRAVDDILSGFFG